MIWEERNGNDSMRRRETSIDRSILIRLFREERFPRLRTAIHARNGENLNKNAEVSVPL